MNMYSLFLDSLLCFFSVLLPVSFRQVLQAGVPLLQNQIFQISDCQEGVCCCSPVKSWSSWKAAQFYVSRIQFYRRSSWPHCNQWFHHCGGLVSHASDHRTFLYFPASLILPPLPFCSPSPLLPFSKSHFKPPLPVEVPLLPAAPGHWFSFHWTSEVQYVDILQNDLS